MLKSSLLLPLILCLGNQSIQAQTDPVKIDILLTGTWNGTSICQIKNSPCHDETVVYHISKNKGTDSFYINASKIVNGMEQEMGILPFVYNKQANQLTSTAYGIWAFKIEEAKLEGTLMVNGDLFRKIVVYKSH
jgi:hypothetical protein